MTSQRDAGYQDTFDERGTDYDDAMVRWPRARAEEFGFALGLIDIKPGARLLDAPAGGGYLHDHLPAGVHYTALETAASFARRCRSRNLTVLDSPIDGAAVPDQLADVIMSIAGVHHEPDLEHVLRSWNRLLTPSGRVVLVDVAAGSPTARFLDDFVGVHNTIGHRGHYFGDDLGQVAISAGYTESAVTDGHYHWWFDDHDAMGNFCITLFGLEGIGTSDVADAVTALLGTDTAPNGQIGLR